MDDIRLGTLLLENRVLQEADLERCLELQSLTGGVRPLGQILVEQGLIDGASLEELLELQARRARRERGSLEVAADGASLPHSPFLRAAVGAGASELFVSEGRPIIARVAGELRTLTDEEMQAPEVWGFVREEMGHDVLEQIAERKEVTRSFNHPGLCRGRISAYRHFDGIAVAIRLHPDELRSAADSRVPQQVIDAILQGKGLLLVSGENGCGLTETLHSLTECATATAGRHVLVLDSVFESEAPQPESGARVVRRQIGEHAMSYADALRSGIRENPDVIIVGDVSEPSAFEMALRAAEGGRMVIAALHAPTVVTTLKRVLNFYAEQDIPRIRATLSSVLVGVLSRKLVPDADHVGMLPASEYLHVDDAAREVLRQGSLKNVHSLMRMADNPGFSFDESLMGLQQRGEARFEDVFHRASDKTWFLQTAQGESK